MKKQLINKDKAFDNNKVNRILLEISKGIIGNLDLEKVLQVISDGISELLEIETAAIYLLEGDDELFLGATTPPLDPNIPVYIRRASLENHPNIQKAISTRQSHFIEDTSKETFTPEEKNVVEQRSLRSILYLPFVEVENVVGILILASIDKIKRFTPSEINLGQTIANQFSIGIQNALLHNDLKQKNQDLETEIKNRVKAEKKLRNTEEKYRLFFENNDAIILFLDPETGQIIFANQSAVDFYGYEKDELIGMHISRINTLSPTEIKKKMAEIMKSKSNRFLFQHKNVFGEIKDVEIYQTKLQLKGSEVFSLIIHDVTDRIQMENDLKNSEERFRKAFQTSPDAININKLDGTFIEINDGFSKITGYTKEEVYGKLSSEVNIWANPDDREKLIQGLTEFGFVSNLETTFRMKDGSLRYGLMSGSVIKIDNEDHILSITRDITERKKIKEKLEESERKYRSTFEAINEGLWDWDLVKDKGTYSESFYKMLGYELGDVENNNEAWGQLLHPEDVESCNAAVQKHLQGETSEFIVEYRLKTKKEGYKWVRAKGKVMEFTEDGKPERILGAIEDIDSIKKAELELKESYVKYKTLAEYTYDWEYWKDPDNNYLYVSPSSKRITGYDANYFLKSNKQFGSIVHPDDIEIWNKHERNSMGKRISCNTPIEFRIIKKDGTITWINHVCQPVYDEEGNYIGNRGTNRDITHQKNIQFELIDSESKYRLLFENMTSGFALHEMIFDKNKKPVDYKFLEVNPAFEQLTGLKKSEIIGKRVLEIMPDLERYWIETYGEIVLKGKSKHYENYSQGLGKYFNTYVFSPEKNKFAVIFHDITEKKLIEEELIKSENKLKLHLEQTPLGVIEWGLKSEILSWNKAAEEIFGYSFEEIKGEIGIRKLIPAFMQDEIEDMWQKTLKKGNDRNTNKNITKGGRIIICDWYNTTIVNEEGKIIGVISMVEDVTEREKIQFDLRKSEERHKMISRIASDYVYSIQKSQQNGDYTIDWVSGGFTRITGYTVKEINCMKDKWDGIIHPHDRLKKSKKKGKQLPISKTRQYRIITKNGNIKWISDNYLPIQSNDGVITGYLGSVMDITERKEAEESLKKSEIRLKRLAEISEEGVLIFDRSTIIEVNNAVSQITGYSHEELIGKNLIDLIDSPDLDYFKRHLKKHNDFPYVFNALTKYGDSYLMEFHSKPYDLGGRACYVASIRDVTKKIEMERALRQHEEYLKQAQKIAHIGHWHWDIIKDEFYYSEEFKEIYEIDSDTLSFRAVLNDFTHESDKERFVEIWKNISKTNFKFDEEYRIETNGKCKWLRGIAEILCNDKGEPISITGLSYDITRKKAIEIEIKKLNQAVEQSFACIVITDTQGIIEYANPRVYQLTGYTEDEVIGQNPRVLSAGTMPKEYYQKMWQQIKSGKTWQGEFHNKKKNGESFWESATISPVINDSGEISHFIAVKDDITEKKQADRQLQENNEKLIELNEQIANYKMMALRSVMNPHFIFNCLNSIQFFIAKNEKKPAISYLSLFSKLMRNVLNSSVERYVSLRKEVETLEYYIELEKLRFDDNFDFVLKLDDELDTDSIEIPSMVIQPYVENAIIHGLSNKQDTGTLTLEIYPEDSSIVCVIEDDGIGRQASMKSHQDLRKGHKSYGMTVTEERLNIINKTDKVQVEIVDLENHGTPFGTKVIMKIELSQE